MIKSHVDETSKQFNILKDEICSIKTHVKVHIEGVSRQIEATNAKISAVQLSVTNSTLALQNRLNSIFDQLKSVQQRETTQIQNRNEHRPDSETQCHVLNHLSKLLHLIILLETP